MDIQQKSSQELIDLYHMHAVVLQTAPPSAKQLAARAMDTIEKELVDRAGRTDAVAFTFLKYGRV